MRKGYASNHRIVVVASAVLASFAMLGMRLVWLHVIDRAHLLTYVQKARKEIIPQCARRGEVLDVRGHVLATSRSLIVLGVDPQSVRREDSAKWPQLARLLGMPLGQLSTLLTTRYRTGPATAGGARADLVSNYRISVPSVTPEEPAAPSEAGDDDIVVDEADAQGQRPIRWAKLSDNVPEPAYAEILKLGVAGVYGNRVFRRTYPGNALAAHVIGYVNKNETPVAGIERYADFYLRGQNGWVESEKDGHQRELAEFRTREVPASDGYSVVLSLDATVQHIAEAELEYIAGKFQPQKATVIVSDPRTGFILAMANYPGFNLNEYNKLTKEQERQMRNVAVADLYEPGSVFKIVAASGALDAGLVTPSTTFDCTLEKVEYKGKMRNLPREDVSDHFDHPLSVAEIIAHSSNKGAAQLAMLLGDQRFYGYVEGFGFGLPTGFPVGGEPGAGALKKNAPPPDKWDGLTITRMPMGQSVAATPLQMHQAMSVLASDGMMLRPQVIKQVRDAAGEIVYRFDRSEVRRVVSERTARMMARLLEAVASRNGNAQEAEIPGYEVAGKTGTAQKVNPDGRGYSEHHHVSSFLGFLPASNPQIVISVIVDDADEHTPGGVGYGRLVAAPSFKHIGEQLISYLDIRPPLSRAGAAALALEGGRR